MDFKKVQPYAPALVRFGISFVFLWFGINQFIDPGYFMGYLPAFIPDTYSTSFVLFNGVFEIIFGLLLLVGYYVRPVSFLLGVHLLGIIFSLGYNDIAIRDVGLMLVTFAITLGGADPWCLGYK